MAKGKKKEKEKFVRDKAAEEGGGGGRMMGHISQSMWGSQPCSTVMTVMTLAQRMASVIHCSSHCTLREH